MTANSWLMQFLADILGGPLDVAALSETTALGAAFHAGQAVGLYGTQADLALEWQAAQSYYPQMSEDEREARYRGWLEAVERVKTSQADRI